MLDGKRWPDRRERRRRSLLVEVAYVFLLCVGLLMLVSVVSWFFAWLVIGA